MSHESRSPRTPADLLSVSLESRGTTAIVRADGEIDMGTAPLVADALTGFATAPDRPDRVVLDLGGITFMSSAGLTILNAHHRRFTELGVRFVVVAAQRSVVRTLDITGVSDLVTVVPDVEAAVTLP